MSNQKQIALTAVTILTILNVIGYLVKGVPTWGFASNAFFIGFFLGKFTESK